MPRAARKRFASRDGDLAEVEDARRRAPRRRRPCSMPCGEVLERADAAARDHRHGDRVGDRARELEVEAALACRRGPCW